MSRHGLLVCRCFLRYHRRHHFAERTREETGQLPVLTGGDFERFWPADDYAPGTHARSRGKWHLEKGGIQERRQRTA